MKNKKDKGNKKTEYDFSKYSLECKYTDKSSFKITKELLKKMVKESVDAQKIPFLIISIPNDENTNFVLHCNISIERKA